MYRELEAQPLGELWRRRPLDLGGELVVSRFPDCGDGGDTVCLMGT